MNRQEEDASTNNIHNAIKGPILALQQQQRRAQVDDNDDSVDTGDDRQHDLVIKHAQGVDRPSVQYLVDFLREEDSHNVTELYFMRFYLADDGGWEVLRDLFASTTTLTKVEMKLVDFGNVEKATQVLAAFQTNRSVTDLKIWGIVNLHGAALGPCLSRILQQSAQLQRLHCRNNYFVDEIHSLVPGVRVSRHLKELCLPGCRLENQGIRLLVDALVGKAGLEVLDISFNRITSAGLAEIARLLESTRIKTMDLRYNRRMFVDHAPLQRFLRILHDTTSLQELDVSQTDLSAPDRDTINSILDRNQSLNKADALLQLQPSGLPFRSKSGVWTMAFAKMGSRSQPSGTAAAAAAAAADTDTDEEENVDGIHNGASAIFKILKARPAILERQLQRPAAAAASLQGLQAASSARQLQESTAVRNEDSGGGGGNSNSLDATAPAQKRRRQS